MKIRRAKQKFALVIISLLIGVFLTVGQFIIPFTDYNYNGFANSIKLGIDLQGGVLAVYDVNEGETDQDFDAAVDATILRLQSLMADQGYTEATVIRQSNGTDTQIRIEVPDVDDPQEILNLIGQPRKLKFRREESSTSEPVLTGDNIKKVQASYQNGEYGVLIEFDGEGTELFFDLTTELVENNDQLYMYLGNDENPFSAPSVQSVIADGTTFISGGYDTLEAAEDFATQILSGTFSVELELFENSAVSATLGANALQMGILAGIIGIVFVFIFMYLVYGTFGLIADLAGIIAAIGIAYLFFH